MEATSPLPCGEVVGGEDTLREAHSLTRQVLRACLGKMRVNRLNDDIDLSKHLRIAEAQYGKAPPLQLLCARRIVTRDGIAGMLPAIDLNHEPCLERAEIHDAATQRDLSAEIRSMKRNAPPQVPPELPFRLCWLFARGPCAMPQLLREIGFCCLPAHDLRFPL